MKLLSENEDRVLDRKPHPHDLTAKRAACRYSLGLHQLLEILAHGLLLEVSPVKRGAGPNARCLLVAHGLVERNSKQA